MKVVVANLNDLTVSLEVTPEMKLEQFKALCEYEVGLTAEKMLITHEGRPLLDNKKNLKDYGIQHGDKILVEITLDTTSDHLMEPQKVNNAFESIRLSQNTLPQDQANSIDLVVTPSTSASSTSVDKVQRFWQNLTNFPDNIIALSTTNPRLVEVFLSGNQELFAQVLNSQMVEKSERERKRTQLSNADFSDPEDHRLITEEILQDNINSNLEAAIEHHPESFRKGKPLFINCKVNDHSVRAFIDTGSETTLMGQASAERCGIMSLIDKRFSSTATGMGVQSIIGRVHFCHIQINDIFLQASFFILEELVPMDLLIGLDILKPHQCHIDLKRNVLVIGTTDTEIPFLSEIDPSRNFDDGNMTSVFDSGVSSSSNSRIEAALK